MATDTIARSARPIGEDLEQRRLELRIRRVEVALAELRGLAAIRPVPTALANAMADFSQELADLRRQLARLRGEAAPPGEAPNNATAMTRTAA